MKFAKSGESHQHCEWDPLPAVYQFTASFVSKFQELHSVVFDSGIESWRMVVQGSCSSCATAIQIHSFTRLAPCILDVAQKHSALYGYSLCKAEQTDYEPLIIRMLQLTPAEPKALRDTQNIHWYRYTAITAVSQLVSFIRIFGLRACENATAQHIKLLRHLLDVFP